MTDHVLLPGAVTVTSDTGGAPGFPESGVTGGPPQWADGSDSTYATTGICAIPVADSSNDWGDAILPNLAIDPETATDIVTDIRCVGFPHSDSTSGATCTVVLSATSGGLLGGIIAFPVIPLDGIVRDHRFSIRDFLIDGGYPVEPVDQVVVEIATALADGPSPLRAIIVGTYSAEILVGRIFELSVTAVTPGVIPEPGSAQTGATRRSFT